MSNELVSDNCSPSVVTVAVAAAKTGLVSKTAEALAIASLSTIRLVLAIVGSILLGVVVAALLLAVLVVAVAVAAELLVERVVFEDSGAIVAALSTVAAVGVGSCNVLGGLTEAGDAALDAAEDIIGDLSGSLLAGDS